MTTTEPGLARSPGLSYQDLLDADTHPVPDVLREQSPRYLGNQDISIERYTTRDWHRREVERLWKRVWQFACREEHIPDVDQRPDDFNLPEVQVGTWAGFVFINPDPDAEPLADFLGGFPEHMAI